MIDRNRVLVIDDDPFIRSLLTAMLRSEFVVSVAIDGMDGFCKAVEDPPDLVIVDIEMPRWDGLRTVNEMRLRETLHEIPVMVLTADSSKQTVMKALKNGANDYFIKTSLSRPELLKKVRRLIGCGSASAVLQTC
jgi:DNA-binding response OmpR family regulator